MSFGHACTTHSTLKAEPTLQSSHMTHVNRTVHDPPGLQGQKPLLTSPKKRVLVHASTGDT
jgi:hypothetical protein